MEDAADIATFVDAARRYCALVERAEELPLAERLCAFAAALAGVYMAGLRLPETAPADGESLEPAARTVRSGS